MARKKSQGNDPVNGLFGDTAPDGGPPVSFVITPESAKAIKMLVAREERIKTIKEQHAEDIKGAATAMGLKPGDVKEMIAVVIKEQEEGGVLEDKEKKVSFARQVISSVVNNEELNQQATYTEDLDKMIAGHDEFREKLAAHLNAQEAPDA